MEMMLADGVALPALNNGPPFAIAFGDTELRGGRSTPRITAQ
jgi:hypothetical protein